MRKSQSATEFIVLISFMFFIILTFFALTSSRVLEAREEGNKKIAGDIADFAYNEIEIAASVSDGYIRVFVLPATVNGIIYSIQIVDNRELIVNYLDNEYIKFLPANVSGNISTGLNKIRKIDGIVYLEYLVECEDGIDNDGDGKIDLKDSGCADESDTDETDCGDNLCEDVEGCLFCSADCGVCPYLITELLFKSNFNNTLKFTDDGNAVLKGTLQENSPPQPASDDEFILKNNGNAVAIVNLITGNMFISGALLQNQLTLSPSSLSDDLIVKDIHGNVIAYLDDAGNFYLKGNLTQNGNP